MNTFKTIIFVLVLISLTSCNNFKKQDTNSIEQQQDTVADMHNAKNSLDWTGVYKGVLPCASCQEIKTTIILNDNNTFERTDIYVKDKEEVFVENGDFSWDNTNNIITLNIKGEVNPQKYKVIEGKLLMLDAEGKENQGELADNYILTKVELTDISGSYFKGEKAKGYYDELMVTSLENDMYAIKISSGKAKKGCNFEGKGVLQNNKIIIDLSTIQQNMKSKMIIEFIENQATINTDNEESRYDLMYFCGGGGSLIGDYIKK